MSKKPVSLAALAAAEVSQPKVAPVAKAHDVVTLQRHNVAATTKRRSHTSLYLSKDVQHAIAEIALAYRIKKPHDLYIEGINLMLAKYGRPSVEEIDGKGK